MVFALERDKLYKDVEGNIWRVVCTDYDDLHGPCIAVIERSKPGIIYASWVHQYLPGGLCSGGERDEAAYGTYRHDLMSEYHKPREFTIRLFDNGAIVETTSRPGMNITSVNNSTKFEEIRVREITE